MASLAHVAVGFLAGRAIANRCGSHPLGPMLACSGLSMLPDLDYLGVALGVPDVGPCGHRGASHSLALPVLVALAAAVWFRGSPLPRWRFGLICGLVVASHPLLDSLTGESRGVPLLWPLSFTRFEMPWRPIPNPPCGLEFVSMAGLRGAAVELVLFLPLLLLAFWPAAPSASRRKASLRRGLGSIERASS